MRHEKRSIPAETPTITLSLRVSERLGILVNGKVIARGFLENIAERAIRKLRAGDRVGLRIYWDIVTQCGEVVSSYHQDTASKYLLHLTKKKLNG